MSATTFAGKTATEWREMASASNRLSLDSFDRCDTDGALSQWANDQMAIRYRRCAQVAEDGGIRMLAYVDIDTGELIRGRWISTRYGSAYAPDGAELIFPSSAENPKVRERNNAKKGIREVLVLAEAALNRRSGEPYVADGGTWTILPDED